MVLDGFRFRVSLAAMLGFCSGCGGGLSDHDQRVAVLADVEVAGVEFTFRADAEHACLDLRDRLSRVLGPRVIVAFDAHYPGCRLGIASRAGDLRALRAMLPLDVALADLSVVRCAGRTGAPIACSLTSAALH